MKFLLLILAILTVNIVSAQSFFKPLPKVKTNRFALTLSPTAIVHDSTFTGFRPVVSVAVYGYTKAQGNALFTGGGISYESDKWNYSTSKWYTNWSIAALGYAGGTSAPTGLSMVEAAGLSFSFLNKLISVGAAYNFEAKQFMPTIGCSISLNN